MKAKSGIRLPSRMGVDSDTAINRPTHSRVTGEGKGQVFETVGYGDAN